MAHQRISGGELWFWSSNAENGLSPEILDPIKNSKTQKLL